MDMEQLAFVNQQIGGMLKAGVPLEGALRQVSARMARGDLRDELRQFEATLAQGTPVGEALASSRLPEFYKRMMAVGAKSGDLPGVLLLTADYYQQANATWTRLKGLMAYPVIVMIGSLALSAFLALWFGPIANQFIVDMTGEPLSAVSMFFLWFPFVMVAATGAAGFTVFASRTLRNRLRWRLPGFREASLAELSHVLGLMVQSGCPLPEAVGLAAQMEEGTPAGEALDGWQRGLSAGNGRLDQLAAHGKLFPPMWINMVANAGDDLAAGLLRAAEFYRSRARYRVEMMLYASLPAAVLVLGVIIAAQVIPVFRAMAEILMRMPNG
jgi:type IV pilus assembly protein PilC